MENSDPATAVGRDPKQTEVGSVFVSNYPPYSFWGAQQVAEIGAALDRAPVEETPLGVYLHIPFCRRRCKFCYFRVYTDKNSKEVERYLDALVRETESYVTRAAIAGRRPKFVYFGGGTPSFISAKHLRSLVARVRQAIPWDGVEEVTFECEPGTLTRAKLEAIRDVGVTRLSLGVENFSDEILRENGRAHVSTEIYRVAPWIDELDFDQLNIDLISGMVGETWRTWRDSVARAIEMQPDSVTVYQMELPFNTVYSRAVLDGSSAVPVADWETKREWHDFAFQQFEQAGYEISSGYTMVKRGGGARFVYRNSVWRGCDLVGLGVSSFSHVNGVHYQNVANWDTYLERVDAGELPHGRAFVPDAAERLTRELILQLKLGRVRPDYFRDKFDVDVLERFADPLGRLSERKMLEVGDDEIRLTRAGLLRVDQLLPEFYAAEYQNARYT